jgi:CMP/dCMP kinase
MSMRASAVSARPVVRRALLDIQRKLGAEKGAVFEGRDMGTVVFPAADVKFFLTADLKARALRRYKELAAISPQNLADVEADMDQPGPQTTPPGRLAPLKPAEDAVIIDSTRQPAKAVVAAMMVHIPIVSAIRRSCAYRWSGKSRIIRYESLSGRDFHGC